MKRAAGLLTSLILLSACGQQQRASSKFEKAGDQCLDQAVPRSFIVRYYDGRIETVSAPSKKEFIEGFLTEHVDQVDFAEHDFKVKIQGELQAANTQSAYADNWGASRVNAQALWQQNVRGAGVAVAVVDTGLDLNHPQLRKQIYSNPGEQGTDAQGRDKETNGVDDDGNGFVDDALGYDFAKNRPLQGDYAGHGTHVSGIIAAAHSDTTAQPAAYVQGVAPSAKILPLAFLDESGSGTMANGVRAIQYAVARGAKVINASWGGAGCSRALKEAIAALQNQGVIMVSAAGNDGQNIDRTPSYPASFDLAAQITVGAVGEFDHMAEYSNFGVRTVHIFAPGTQIVSTYPGGGMAAMSGTSMATPFVAGAVALLLSAEPSKTVDQIRQALYRSSVRRAEYINASQGRMDLSQALAELRK